MVSRGHTTLERACGSQQATSLAGSTPSKSPFALSHSRAHLRCSAQARKSMASFRIMHSSPLHHEQYLWRLRSACSDLSTRDLSSPLRRCTGCCCSWAVWSTETCYIDLFTLWRTTSICTCTYRRPLWLNGSAQARVHWLWSTSGGWRRIVRVTSTSCTGAWSYWRIVWTASGATAGRRTVWREYTEQEPVRLVSGLLISGRRSRLIFDVLQSCSRCPSTDSTTTRTASCRPVHQGDKVQRSTRRCSCCYRGY